MKNYHETILAALATLNAGRMFELAKKRAAEILESGDDGDKFSACSECENPEECATAVRCTMRYDAMGKAIGEGPHGGYVLVQIAKARAVELLGSYQRPDAASGDGEVAKSSGNALIDIAKARAAELTKSAREGRLMSMGF